MKIRFLKLNNWLMAFAAGLLGITFGCDRNEIVCEYGVPESEFEVKGRVTNGNGEPVAGIVARMVDPDYAIADSSVYSSDTTDTDGRYEMTARVYGNMAVDVEFKDVDGPANGEYADTTVNVSFRDAEYDGGNDGWYRGHATKQLDVTLREK